MRKISRRQLSLLFGDICIIIFSFYVALIIRTGERFSTFHHAVLVCSLAVAYIASFYIFELYNFRRVSRSTNFLTSMGGAFGLVYIFAILIFYIFPYKLGRGVFFISWALTGLIVLAWRLAYVSLFKFSQSRRNVMILGDKTTTEPLIAALENDPEFRLAAVLEIENVKEELEDKFVEKNEIDDIVVSVNGRDLSELERALVNCRMKGINCYTIEAFYERLLEKLPVLMLSDRWFLTSGGFDKLGNRFYKSIKRAVDFTFAGLILLITLPLSTIVALLILLTSKGPILFTQERLGAGKKPFRIIKFRTMVHNAEVNGPQWAQNNDRRVTKLGKILRKTRIDEIPQLINVLKGDMSLIGPRPEREYFVDQLSSKIPFYSLRFFVKPGITGWAQVNFRYGSDEKDALEKLRYELYYIKNQSLFLDFRITMKTIRVILFGMGT
ncbi:MAG TPA: sugar transferase [Candidatus Aminicenantes bacterium]|nr:sugar transferase [Candidatus Aminicenantes bacterium]